MIIRFLFILTFLMTIATPSLAELTIDVSEPTLEISTGFTGDTLTLFGTATPKGDIVILVKGPKKDTIIRRKKDIFGLWIHATSIEFKDVHGYYNVASSKTVSDITSPEIRAEYNMGINSLNYPATKTGTKPSRRDRFHEALIQQKQLSGLYSLTPNAVDFMNAHLFKTHIYMPANVPLGDYEIEAFLFRNGQLIDHDTHPFRIKQVGLTASIHDFANQKPFWYGLTIIFIAIFSSFLAVLLLRRD